VHNLMRYSGLKRGQIGISAEKSWGGSQRGFLSPKMAQVLMRIKV